MSFNDCDIRYLKGVGEKRAEKLYKLGIDTVGALLRFYPRGYEDWSVITPIYDCTSGEKVCVRARISTPIKEHFIRKNMTLYRFEVCDNSGSMPITIFNNKFLAAKLNFGCEYLFYGKISADSLLPAMSSPEVAEVGTAGIKPVYNATAGFGSKAVERLVKIALSAGIPEDPIPEEIRCENGLCELRFALENIHFPRSREALERAKARLVFEELFILQMGLSLLKGKSRTAAGSVIDKSYKQEFLGLLPFSLTGAQNRVIDECIADMMSGRLMNRLVQGDVGSGKTAVAAALMHTVAKCGMQSALMAPTEILAEQHFLTLSSMLKGSGIGCVLLTGSMKKREKDSAKEALSDGTAMIAVGTHALISDDVHFSSLGLVITDEQHRFGVAQRAKLAAKGVRPHTLVMSATPIPRTLALIIYGDLDISIIDEYPRGRQKIESYCVTGELRTRVWNYIKKHLDEGRQGYVVCPLVEENEELDILSAEEYFEDLKRSSLLGGYKIGLLHGKQKPREKDAVMRAFKDGEIQLLVCTTVVEVGIDVPNAAIMVIENSERFGLSQLHQLRGRIGRGEFKSTCIFISDITGGVTAERLSVIKNNSDGFRIADEDLRLRGPGDFLGNRQHGLPTLRIADLYADSQVLRSAGQAAMRLLESDPKLLNSDNAALRAEIKALYKKLNEN